MPSHPLDFQLQANVFCTPELLDLFDERNRIGRWLKIEAALAMAQAELGLIPKEAAREIERRASLAHLDEEMIREGYTRSRNSLLPVIGALRSACGAEWGQYVHYGATTQDIIDTGQVLEIAQTMRILYRDLREVEGVLLDLTAKHRDTPMVGRTHGQQALPVTFGLKTAGWAAEIRRHIQRCVSLYPRISRGQLSGGVGTLAAMGSQGMAVARRTMELLGLDWQPPGWHTGRDTIAEYASFCAIMVGTLEKIANEVFLLGKSEVGELAEEMPATPMSSAMPHKRNPVLSQRVTVLALHVRAQAAVVVESMAHEHERDPRRLWSEWLAIPQLSMYSGTALHYMARILSGLEVHQDAMLGNLRAAGDQVMSEWLLNRLARDLGRTRAREKLHQILQATAAEGSSLREALCRDRETGQLLGREDIDMLDHPERYTGQAGEMIDAVLADIAARREQDPEEL
ncbi:MAG: adenylosuccinate lyase [Desulfobulbaceae bacterium]